MKRTLLIIGSGYVGTKLASRALDMGWRVVVTTRDASNLDHLQGATIVAWDILKDAPTALASYMGASTSMVYSIPTLMRTYEPPDAQGDAPHLTPVKALLACAEAEGLERCIYLSSTSVYGDQAGRWVDEQTPPQPNAALGKMRAELEALFLSQSWTRAFVGRIVGIYGPGRTLVDYLQRGRYQLVDGGQKRTNRIHVDDIVTSIMAMLEHQEHRSRVYNLCDGHPVTVRELVAFLVEHTSLTWPEEVDMETYASTRPASVVARWKNSYLCRNDRLVHELGVTLQYPTVLDGYRAMIEREELV